MLTDKALKDYFKGICDNLIGKKLKDVREDIGGISKYVHTINIGHLYFLKKDLPQMPLKVDIILLF